MQAANDFWVYLNIIRNRLWLTILLFLVTVGVILSISYTAEPVYRATVRLQVLATDPLDVSLFTQYRSTSTIVEIQQAQNDFMRTLKSGFVAWKTIADLNLEIGAVDLLLGLSTATEGDFIIVTVESDDPGRAEAIATTQVNNALADYRKVQATPAIVFLEFVSELLASAEPKMVGAEKALTEFKLRNNIDSIERETRSLQDVIRNLKLERERALIERDRAAIFANIYRAEQEKANQKAEELKEKREEEKETEPSETEAKTASVEKEIEPSETEAKAESDEAIVAPATKKFYIDLARQHEATAINYEAQRDGYAQSLQIYDQMTSERAKELQSLLELYDEYYSLERALARARSDYEFLLGKQNEARLKQEQAERLGYIQITEPARKPDQPVASKTRQLVLVGGVVSILAGFVLSFLIEFLGLLRKAGQKQRVS